MITSSSLKAIAAYVEHPGNYSHGWNQGTLHTTFDTRSSRNIFTTVFYLLNLFIGFAGAFFLNERNLRRLRSKREVPMNHLTSWMSATDTVAYAWDTFQLPGGFYGLLMFATAAFGLVHQYFVNSFIVPAQFQSNCTFDLGIVTILNYNEPPSSAFHSAHTVFNAQLQAVLNGGAWGIYDKVNYTSATFRPTSQDVIGRWNCVYYPNSTIAWGDWQDQKSLISFLQNQTFLFDHDSLSQANQAGFYFDDYAIDDFLAWDAFQPELTIPGIVRASVSTNLNGSQQPSNRIAPVTNLECQLLATAGRTLPEVDIISSLLYWRDETFGLLRSYPSDFFGFGIEWMLNAMVMVAGSGNVDTWDQSRLPIGTRNTFGCIVQGTQIMVYIWAILGALLLVLVPLVLVDIFLLLSEHFRLKRSAKVVQAAPSNLQKWQLAILRWSLPCEKINARQMRDYSYGWDAAKEKYVLDKNTAFRKQSCTESTVAHISSEPANLPHDPPGPAFSGFIGQRRSFARLVPMA